MNVVQLHHNISPHCLLCSARASAWSISIHWCTLPSISISSSSLNIFITNNLFRIVKKLPLDGAKIVALLMFWLRKLWALGMGQGNKTDEFSKKFKSGGVKINPKKLYCRIRTFKQGYFGASCNTIFRK